MKMLILSSFRKQKGSLIGILLLLLIISLCVFSSIMLYISGRESVSAEMDRLGFGNITVWINGEGDLTSAELEALPEVSSVIYQPLIYTGYAINGKHSDNEGQLIVYDGTVPYSSDITSSVENGTVYISPALASSFDVAIGDTIQFEVSRQNGIVSLTVAGYFEDAFMGSSMIDMKSFLISKGDRDEIQGIIDSAKDYDVLGRRGAMLHIFQDASSNLSEADFQKLLYQETSLSLHTEFSYGKETILGYMLLLQNILTGFMLAFSCVLLVICLVVISHSLSAVIEQNKRDMAVLKTIGLPGITIRRIYMLLYGVPALLGLSIGIGLSYITARMLANAMITSTGMLITVTFPYIISAVILLVLALLLVMFVYLRTYNIMRISPMQTIRQAASIQKPVAGSFGINSGILPVSIAQRELLSGKRKYAGICLISLVLVIFLSVIGKMGSWLGASGEGLMNAFSVADHDLGVQPFNETVDMQEIERVINWYSPIVQKYELAMESVTVNGREYTANVLNDTKWFHVLSGSVCDGDSILITDTVANEQGLSVGDCVNVASGGRSWSYIVSGIYQCANGMGSNIGMSLAGYSKIGNINGYIWCYHYILENGAMRDYAMHYLQDSYRGIDVHTNSWSGLDGIVMLMHILIAGIYAVAALFIFVSVYLSASKLLQSETGNMAIYKSLGVSSGILRVSFAFRFVMVVSVGALLGTIISHIFAGKIISGIFKMFGIGAFESGVSFMGTFLPPLAVILLFFGFAWISSARIRRINLVKLISENNE